MGRSQNIPTTDLTNAGLGLRHLRRHAMTLACLLLLVCFVIGADYYRSVAVIRTSKQVSVRSAGNIVPNPAIALPVTGGDTCGSATAIGSLPYNDSATTVGITDNYDLPVAFTAPTVTGCPACNATGGGPAEAAPRGGVYLGTGTAADVAYSISFSSSNNSLDVTLTPTGSDDLSLIVYTDVCSSSLADAIVVDDDGGGGEAEHVVISNMPAGTYNVVVDGYSTGGTPPGPSGPYTLAVNGTGIIVGGATPTGTPTPGGPSISGTVTYGNAIGNPVPPRFVKNVSVASTSGTPAVGPVLAGTPGTYTLTGFGSGAYTIKPTKPGGPNAAINSFDAARVAQGVSGSVPFVSQNQRFTSDVNASGSVTSNDAANIARFAAGLPPNVNTVVGAWRFFVTGAPSPLPTQPATYNDSRTYASVTSSVTGEDYIALLVGEASGNYNTATNPRPVTGPEKSPAVTTPRMVTPAGKEIVIPVNVNGAICKEIISYEFDLRYDPTVIEPLENPVEVAGTVSRGLLAVANPFEPGLLRVVLYGPMPIEADGLLINLRFTSVGAGGSVSPLTFERMIFNDIDALDSVTNGQISLSTASD
jgi:hypothetical protein